MSAVAAGRRIKASFRFKYDTIRPYEEQKVQVFSPGNLPAEASSHTLHTIHLGMGSPDQPSWCMTLRVQITKVQADLPQKNSKNLGHASDL
jgi:hypothetical protein